MRGRQSTIALTDELSSPACFSAAGEAFQASSRLPKRVSRLPNLTRPMPGTMLNASQYLVSIFLKCNFHCNTVIVMGAMKSDAETDFDSYFRYECQFPQTGYKEGKYYYEQ